MARQQMRQAEGCTTLMETQTWLPPDYDTCSMHLTELACNEAVLASACPSNKVASPVATSLATAAHTPSSNIPPHLASSSSASPSDGKSGLKLGLGLCFGILAVVLIVALFIACAKKLHLTPGTTMARHPALSTRVRRQPLSTTPQIWTIHPRHRPQTAPSTARPPSRSSSSPPSGDAGNRADNVPSRGRHPPTPESNSDLTDISWSSEGQYDRISSNRSTMPAGPNNMQRGHDQWMRQWIGENAVIEIPLVDVQNPEAPERVSRQARMPQEDDAGSPRAPPTVYEGVPRNRVHFQPTVEDYNEAEE